MTPPEVQLHEWASSLDILSKKDQFTRAGEFLFFEEFLPPALREACLREVRDMSRHIHRVHLPGKKSGSISFFRIRQHAPTILSLYRSPAFRRLLQQLVGKTLHECAPQDPHSCSAFIYDRPGDHIGFHTDSCHYSHGLVYTVLIGLVDRSTAKLECHLSTGEQVDVSLGEGGVAFFNGCNVRHRVTPLGHGEERVVLSCEFLLDPYMSPIRRLVANIDHGIKYFGLGSVLEAYFPGRGRGSRG